MFSGSWRIRWRVLGVCGARLVFSGDSREFSSNWSWRCYYTDIHFRPGCTLYIVGVGQNNMFSSITLQQATQPQNHWSFSEVRERERYQYIIYLSCLLLRYDFLVLIIHTWYIADCVLELFGWMSELKMSKMNKTLETHKKGIESQVTSHSENLTLYAWVSRCWETWSTFHGRPTRGRGGGTRPWANHTSMVEKNFPNHSMHWSLKC